MARAAVRNLVQPFVCQSLVCSRRAYAPGLESQPVASTSQAFIARQEPLKPAKSPSSRAKGKERAVESEELGESETRRSEEAKWEPEAAVPAADASTSHALVNEGSAEASTSSGEAIHLDTSQTARYPSSDVLSTSPVNPSLSLNQLRHPFNTHSFVEHLIAAGVPRPRAEVLMEAARILAGRELERARKSLVSRITADNDAYLHSAALAEMRTEIQVDVREETLAQRSANARIHRRIESLNQTTTEQVEQLKSEIKYEFQHSRDETNADFKSMELRLQDVTNRMSLEFGIERADIENLKWFLLRNTFLAVVTFGLFSVGLNEWLRERPKLPTVEAFGIKAIENPEAELVESGPVRRVGEEESM